MLRYGTHDDFRKVVADELKDKGLSWTQMSFKRTLVYEIDGVIIGFAGLNKEDNYLFMKIFPNNLSNRRIYLAIKQGLEQILSGMRYCVVVRENVPTSERLLKKLGFRFYAEKCNLEYWVKWAR